VVKRKMSNFGVKRARHRAWPQPTLPPAQAVVVVGPSKPAPPAGHAPPPADLQPAPNQPNQPKYRH
jgi:hypothetical protein